MLARWLDSGLFHPEPEGTADENYSIAIPPPNVTGALHMGHALNGSIQDTLIRYAPHARASARSGSSAPTTRASRRRRRSRSCSSERGHEPRGDRPRGVHRARVALARAVRRHDHRAVQAPRRLAATTRTSASRSTSATPRAVLKVFVDALREGPDLPRQLHGQLGPGLALGDLRPRGRGARGHRHALLRRLPARPPATARSRSPPCARRRCSADTAIAVHPDDERYTRLVGETAILPLVGRRLQIIADDYVKPEFGTGALKITPGHDPNDFEIGRRHGLDELTVIGEDGRMTAAAGERFAGLTALEAREAVVAALREEGRIDRTEPYTHDVPFSQRSGERIEPLISLQWFMRMDELAAPAIDAVERRAACAIHPERRRARLPRLAGEHPPVVHLAPAVVGPPAARSGTAATETYVGMRPARRAPGWERTPTCSTRGSRRRCGRSRRSAGPTQTARAEGLLPDRRALDGARHPLPVGRPDGHDGARVRRRHPVRRRLHPLGHPGARRAPDVEVARHGHRPAGADRRRPRPPVFTRAATSRLRRRRRALRPAGDVLHAGRALQRGEDRRRASQLANKLWNASRLVLLRVPRGRRAAGRRAARRRRSRTAGSSRACRPPSADVAERDRRVRVPPRRARALRLRLRRAVRLVPGAASSRACTPRTTTATTSPRRCCTCWPRRSRSRTR